jgi:cysteine-rich repeat protein
MNRLSTFSATLAVSALLATLFPVIATAAPGNVLSEQKIAQGVGGFSGPLSADDWFGYSCDGLGDFDDDGVPDLVVGTGHDDDGGDEKGAVWILLLNDDGTVKEERKISELEGGFTGPLDIGDRFGRSVAPIGDLDGNGTIDLVVGSRQDDDGGPDRGALWILFMNSDATVASTQKISSTQGGFTGTLTNYGWFGISVDSIGDVDGDGVVDLAVGQIFDDGGAVWILFLNDDGTVKAHHKIQGADIGATDLFGEDVSYLGDVDSDGVGDIVVAELQDGDGGYETGAIWIVRLNADGSMKAASKISATQGGFTGTLDPVDHFGSAVEGVGDVDGDSVVDAAGAAGWDDDGGVNKGAVWIFFLDTDGTVKSHAKISSTVGGFDGTLQQEDQLGRCVGTLGDVNGDAMVDLATGAIFDNTGGSHKGAVWLTFLESAPLGPTTTTTTLPPVCGDGAKGGAEECDDGNQVSGDGCSDTCACEAATDADGDGIGDYCDACPNDAQNDADGDSICGNVDACPLDNANDTDGDGLCGNIDNCRDVANPGQSDADADGVGDDCDSCPGEDDTEDTDADGFADACDLCTNVLGARDIDIDAVAWFRRIALLGQTGNETFDFTGEFVLPASSSFADIQPLDRAVRLQVKRNDGIPVIDVTLPMTEASTGAGWKVNGRQTRWLYRNRLDNPDDGITAVSIEDRSRHAERQVRLKVRGRHGTYDLPFGTEPFQVTLVVGDPALGECGETTYSAAQCTYFKGHVSLVCNGDR